MPNEVEETIRVLNKQIGEYESKHREVERAYDEFSLKCESKLEKRDFDFISDLLYRLEKYYKNKSEESLTARKEVMDKYGIPYE